MSEWRDWKTAPLAYCDERGTSVPRKLL